MSTMRDWEHARTMAPELAVAYVRVIAKYQRMVEEVVL